MRSKTIALLVTSFLVITAAAAQNESPVDVDSFILVTDNNSPDMMTATAAGAETGIPVLTTSDGDVDENVTDTLSEAGAEEVIIIGGPAVVSEDVENKIRGLGYIVRRLWGLERTKTAIEVARNFWRRTECAVLVEDTYTPEDDSLVQTEAASQAMIGKCPLIPIPDQTMPLEVLELLSELEVANIIYVGSGLTSEMEAELSGYNVIELTGTLAQIRNKIARRVLNKTETMIVVATPNWREGLGWGPALDNTTYVRRVTSMNDVPDVIDLINEYNISRVIIAGQPFLAGQVYNELLDNGIESVRYAARKSIDIARRVWNALKNEVQTRRDIKKLTTLNVNMEWRERVKEILNDTKTKIAELQAEIEELKSEGADTTELEALSEEADSLVEQAEGNITNYKLALRLLNAAKNKLKVKLWVNRTRLNWNWRERLQKEIDSYQQIMERLKIAAEEGKLSQYLSRCGLRARNAIRDLLLKARELKQAADEETDRAVKARLLVKAKTAFDLAKRIGRACINRGSISEALINKTALQITNIEALRSKITGALGIS